MTQLYPLRFKEILRNYGFGNRWMVDGFECKTRPATLREGANRRTFAFACTYFALERLDLVDPYVLPCDGERFTVLSQIRGRSTVVHGNTRELLRPSHTCLLPATLGEVTLAPDGPCSLLRAYVPDLRRNIVAPLRQAGIADADILALGGKTRLNPLVELLQ